MVLDISGLYFFMPIFSFLFVFFIIYALLSSSKIIGNSNWVHGIVAAIVSIVFMSFSSAELYVRQVLPWFVILVVVVFMILLLAGFTKNLDKITKPWFAWMIIIILGIVFLVSAIKVFNPVLHPDLIITSGESPGIVQQIKQFFVSSSATGSVILVIVTALVFWAVTKK